MKQVMSCELELKTDETFPERLTASKNPDGRQLDLAINLRRKFRL